MVPQGGGDEGGGQAAAKHPAGQGPCGVGPDCGVHAYFVLDGCVGEEARHVSSRVQARSHGKEALQRAGNLRVYVTGR